LSPEAYREKLEAEVRNSLDLTEFSQHVTNAVRILQNEGQRYLSKHENDDLMENLDNLRYRLANIDLNHLENDILKTTLLISKESCASIQKIGIAKYSEKHLSDSLSIFAFLASLDSENPDYWYRLGLVAQESELNDLALRAYATVLQLAPEFIGAKVFIAQCYLNTKQRDKALIELAEIKNLLKTTKTPQNWNKHMLALESLLAA
jgi:tetratricopeptide (TPR) repeat protein